MYIYTCILSIADEKDKVVNLDEEEKSKLSVA
jgi:hypothetical protein